MRKYSLLAICVGCGISMTAAAQSPTTTWKSDVVGDYLNEKVGSTVQTLTDVENGSRWYWTGFLKSGYTTNTNSSDRDIDSSFLTLQMRIRGVTKITDDIGFLGDVRMETKETVNEVNGQVSNDFDGLDDNQYIDQFRVGFESDKYGSLAYGKYTANMVPFITDIGELGLYDTQADYGGKNADKIIYDSHFDNNLYLYATYDLRSEISGIDIGYQTADTYAYLPDSYGFYLSAHNGQPMLEHGGSYIAGNAGSAKKSNDSNSDSSNYERTKTDLYTYSITGYKMLGRKHRFAANVSYSDKATGETRRTIEENGYAAEGFGMSAELAYIRLPEGGKGFAPVVIGSTDILGDSVDVGAQYWFNPRTRIWVSQVMNDHADDILRIRAQLNF